MKKICKYSNSIFHPLLELASNHMCCVVFIILLLLINYDRIIAEVTTPIRCAITGNTTKVLVSVEEWQKQRGIEKLKPLNEKEYRELSKSLYSAELTASEKQLIPSKIILDGKEYEFAEGYINSGVIVYSREKNNFNIFTTHYRVAYDVFLKKIILSADDVYGQYWTLMGPGSKIIRCKNPSNYHNLIIKLYQYNFETKNKG